PCPAGVASHAVFGGKCPTSGKDRHTIDRAAQGVGASTGITLDAGFHRICVQRTASSTGPGENLDRRNGAANGELRNNQEVSVRMFPAERAATTDGALRSRDTSPDFWILHEPESSRGRTAVVVTIDTSHDDNMAIRCATVRGSVTVFEVIL